MARKGSNQYYKDQISGARDETAHEVQRRKSAESNNDTVIAMLKREEEAYAALAEQAGREICDLRQQALDLSNEVIRVKAAAFDLVTQIREAQ